MESSGMRWRWQGREDRTMKYIASTVSLAALAAAALLLAGAEPQAGA